MSKILGIIGGGQLGMMLTEAAQNMKEEISKVIVLDPVSYTHLTLPPNREV